MDWSDGKANRSITRRRFLQGTAIAAGVVSAGVSLPGKALIRGIKEADAAEQNKAEQVFESMCRDDCNNGCRLKVHVRDGRVVKTSIAELPDNRYGKRICLRGLCHPQRLYSAERLKYPMKRVGERGEGKWERISWDEAIDTIASEVLRIQKEYGKQAILFNPTDGQYGVLNGVQGVGAVTRLANVMGASTVDVSVDYGIPAGTRKVIGGSMSDLVSANEKADTVNARTIIAIGANHTESELQSWRFTAEALERGANFVVVDPTFTCTAAKSTLHVPVRPGSDAMLVLSWIQVIIEERLYDEEFMMAHTVAPFLVRQDTKKFLRQSDLSGVSPADGESDPYIVWDTAAQRPAVLGTETAAAALEGSYSASAIAVKTAFQMLKEHSEQYKPETVADQIETPPDVIRRVARMYATETPSMFDVGFSVSHYGNSQMLGHALATAAAITGNIGKRGTGIGQHWYIANFSPGTPLNPDFLSPTGESAPWVPALVIADVVKTGKYMGQDFPIKALFTPCGNPVSANADQRKWLDEILPQLDLIVAHDIHYTDTVKYADIALPAAHWFETEDINGIMAHNPHIQYSNAVVSPQFEAKADIDFFRLLADKIGVGEYFKPTNAEFIEMFLDSDYARDKGITASALMEKGAMKLLPTEGSDDLYIFYSDYKFPTASGRMEFYSDTPLTRFDFGQDYSTDYAPLAEWRPPFEAWPGSPLFAKYPLVLYTEHWKFSVHSQYQDCAWLRELYSGPMVKMSPQDAAARGIVTGDLVEVFNDRGHVFTHAFVNEGLRVGHVNIPHAYQSKDFQGGSYQELSSQAFDPVTVDSTFFDVLVDVRKA